MSFFSPPYRADIVGSFLRPEKLKTLRAEVRQGCTEKREELARIEDESIKNLVVKEVELGLKAVTDGEFRRHGWLYDFHFGFNNILCVKAKEPVKMFSKTLITDGEFPNIVGDISFNSNHPFFDAFLKLKSVVPDGVIPKLCIPAPSMLLGIRFPLASISLIYLFFFFFIFFFFYIFFKHILIR
jgi:methionine synthase II (cobalamin-independent)